MTARSWRENSPMAYRRRWRLCVLMCILGGCTSSNPQDPNATAVSMSVSPDLVIVSQDRSVTTRVDINGLPAGASVAGFSSDLPETVADIDITTQPCPPGVGSVSCQDWTIRPGMTSAPGDYEVRIRPLGATVPIGVSVGLLKIRVRADPMAVTRPAIAVESSRGRGVPDVSLGNRNLSDLNHALFITDDGSLFGYGDNTAGQVAQRYLTTIDEVQPFRVTEPIPLGPAGSRWRAVATGAAPLGIPDNIDQARSFALRDDDGDGPGTVGTVWAWGRDQQGIIVGSPVQAISLTNITAISAIERDSWLVLDSAGQVYGGGTTEPVLVSGTTSPLAGVTAIAGGTPRPLTDPTFIPPVLIGNGYVLKADGRPAKIFSGHIFSTNQFRLFSGDIFGAGLNNVIQIAAGEDHFLALRSDGVVLAEGDNEQGQLGNGSTVDARFDRLCRPGPECRSSDDTIVVFTRDPVHVSGMTTVIAIAAKGNRSFALLQNGTVWTWGGGILTPVQVQNLDNVKAIGAGYAIRNDCPGTGGTLWGIQFSSGAPPTAERVPGVGDNSGCTIPSFTLALGAL